MLKKLSVPVLVLLSCYASPGFAEEDVIREAILKCCATHGYQTMVECDMDKKAQETCAMQAANTKIEIRETASENEATFKFGSPEVEKIMQQSENAKETTKF